MEVMKKALSLNQNAFVMEDDLIFCEDFQKRFANIDEWMSRNDWDVFWLGGTVHHKPVWWHGQPHNRELNCNCPHRFL